ncbi:uncharacterized protein RAG0_02352 [Rhynchosporium agropyri]|uniref:Uncharacterized protein n=1 Tax=Rhynchosporium agropyri TaxID=914238 RepID=A0A1E1K1F2_9HELO|nr:uncharacterized protein RAG0_02352 [Rhynchosporium agropyri]
MVETKRETHFTKTFRGISQRDCGPQPVLCGLYIRARLIYMHRIQIHKPTSHKR